MIRDAARLPHRVSLVTFPGGQILDVTGPLEVFSRAARWLRDKGHARQLSYVARFGSPHGGIGAIKSGPR